MCHYLAQSIAGSEIIHFGVPELGIPEHENYKALLDEKSIFDIESKGDLDFACDSQIDGIIRVNCLEIDGRIQESAKSFVLKLISEGQYGDTFGLLKQEKLMRAHIRGGDIWQTKFFRNNRFIHENYMALPISFYEKIMANSRIRLELVMEDGSPRWYQKEISHRLKGVEIASSKNLRNDFFNLMFAEEVAIGVSTFSWMAALLGGAKTIHFPVVGLLDKIERPDLDFAISQRNVKTYKFPVHKWTGTRADAEWLFDAPTWIEGNFDK
jgi:hypothetical protein